MKKFIVVTTDGFIVGNGATRKEADARASQQARQLGETIIVKRFDNFDYEYVEVARVTC